MSHVFGDDVAQDVDFARLRVYRYVHRVGAAGVKLLGRLEVVAGFQPDLSQIVNACWRGQSQHLGKGQRQIRRGAAYSLHQTFGQLKLRRVNVQVRCRHRQYPLAQLLGRAIHRVPCQRRPAAGVGAAAVGRQVGAAVVDGDALQRHAQSVGANLGEDGLVALAHGGDAQIDGDLRPGRVLFIPPAWVRLHPPLAGERPPVRPAGVGDYNPGALAGVSGAGALDETGCPDAVILAVNAAPGCRLQRFVVNLVQCLPQQLWVVAAVVDDGIGFGARLAHLVGHHRGRDEILQPELRRVNTQIRGHHVEHPLAEEAGLVASGGAERAHAHLVGQHALDVPPVVGDVIRPSQQGGGGRRHRGAVGAHVTAQRAQHPGPHPQDGAVAAGGDFQLADVFAGMIGGYEMLGPVFSPLYRAPGLDGGEGHQEVLGVKLAPHAEPAAHVRLHEVNPVLRHLEQRRENSPVVVGDFSLAPDG